VVVAGKQYKGRATWRVERLAAAGKPRSLESLLKSSIPHFDFDNGAPHSSR
jgi:hypothetical protein